MRTIITTLLLLTIATMTFASDYDQLNEQIMSLLRQYSEEGTEILEMEKANENDDNPWNPAEFLVFAPYTEENIVKSLPVVVHECFHGLERYGQDLVSQYCGRGDFAYRCNYFYFEKDNFAIVKRTETFPSRELVVLFPDSIQSRFLYFPYIKEFSDIVSTQQSGIFGLLSEFNAYYRSAKTTADMFPYYEKLGPEADWMRFLIDITFNLYACYEFKYYILTYLQFAEQYHPSIYKQLINHKPFIYDFFENQRLIDELFAYYLEGREYSFKLLESYGWRAWADSMNIYIKKNGRTHSRPHLIDAGMELDEWMNEGELKRQLDKMRESIAGWDRNIFWEDLEKMTLQLPEQFETVNDAWEPFKRLHVIAADTVKDVSFPFIDFTRAGVALNPDGSLWIHMEMSNIPEKLACGQSGVRPGEFEYSWKMIFSIIGDSVTFYTINLYEYYGSEPYMTDIMRDCPISIYSDGSLVENVEIRGRQVGNTLILHIEPNTYFQVPRDKVRIYFETLHNNGIQKTHDYLPDYRMGNTLILDKPMY